MLLGFMEEAEALREVACPQPHSWHNQNLHPGLSDYTSLPGQTKESRLQALQQSSVLLVVMPGRVCSPVPSCHQAS